MQDHYAEAGPEGTRNMAILIGTAGYSYDDWLSHFYPEATSKRDFLGYYAQRFALVEVNYTFYRMPSAATLAAMSRKTGPDFQFIIKATSSLTHERDATAADFSAFAQAITPLREEGKLACVLAQFPYSFHANPDNVGYLRGFREQLADWPVVIEFRNAKWVTQRTFEFLRGLDFGFCCVDQPRFKNLMPPVAEVTSDIGYLRFHGRNYRKWFEHEEAWERYDYLYSEEELGEWVDKVADMSAKAQQVYVVFNNHYQAQAVQNALQFTEMLKDAGLPVS